MPVDEKKEYVYHYVYRISNKILHKHYYGVRSCNINPKEDLGFVYFSSSVDKEFKNDQRVNPQNYRYKIIRVYDTRDKADLHEIYLHNKFEVSSNDNFYNRAIHTSIGFSMVGRQHLDETKQKISKANKGKVFTEEHCNSLSKAWETRPDVSEKTRKKISEIHKGKVFTEEHKNKISKSLSGKTKSIEHCLHMSQASNNSMENNPMFGKVHSDETKKLISERLKGRKQSEETILKRIESIRRTNEIKKLSNQSLKK